MYNLEEIKSEKYISLETYRKNNQPVKTPVWFVIKNDLIYVVTRDQTGKVKRLRNNLQVKFALCTIKGKVTGEWVNDRNTLFRHGREKVKICRERPRGARLQGPPATTGVANWPGLRVSGRAISDNGVLCQLQSGLRPTRR